MTNHQKRHRLPLERYGDPGAVWHVTLNTNNRQPHLANPKNAELLLQTLTFSCSCRKADANLLLYCFMPDHAHLLIAIQRGDLIGLMRDVKSWTTRQWQGADKSARLWQPSFHDKGIRVTENLDALVRYITENPVRKGLTDDWTTWPWIGGSLIDET